MHAPHSGEPHPPTPRYDEKACHGHGQDEQSAHRQGYRSGSCTQDSDVTTDLARRLANEHGRGEGRDSSTNEENDLGLASIEIIGSSDGRKQGPSKKWPSIEVIGSSDAKAGSLRGSRHSGGRSAWRRASQTAAFRAHRPAA